MNCMSSIGLNLISSKNTCLRFCLEGVGSDGWFADTTELGRIEPGEEKVIIPNEKNSIIPVIDGH